MKKRKREKGSSLIEVVVSMLILAIGMVAGLGMAQTGQGGLEAGRRISYAAGLAQAKMEETVSMTYPDLLSGNLEGQDDWGGFVRTWTVLPDTPQPRRSTIRVTVEWKDKAGRPHRMGLVTLRSEGVVP